jgi:transcriptional regulator with XRE-family HTH domain
MEKRLLLFLQSEDMNPTRFADKIGVQRSSISHILSGRNKPSYDFLVRIMDGFPQLNAEWLLTGKGKMYKSDTSVQPTLFDQVVVNKQDTASATISEGIKKQTIPEISAFETKLEINTESERIEDIVYKSKQERKNIEIEKIVIFYIDRTFREYLQD